ncbi:hypothetical protein Avbf_02875 [Armadillidium vulgare]|nr:hypothetical protein Avbf_02875 [Armadillidium vulgare]
MGSSNSGITLNHFVDTCFINWKLLLSCDSHSTSANMNGAGGYVGAAAGFASTPGGYTSVPRLHHCNAHSFLCSNPAYHQYQVSGGCLGHPPNYVTPFVAAGHAAPILSHSASTQLLPAASHPQLYTQPAVSIGQPPVQQIGPSAQQAVSAPAHALQHPQIPHPHHHHHQHHHHPHQQPTIVSPFPSHTHIHQIPHTPHAPTSTGARGSGIEVLSRGLYRSSSQGHVIGRVRRGGTLPGMGGNRRGGNTWRGGNMQPVPPPTLPPPPLPTTAAAAAAYPGILLHFLAMLSHPSLHQFNSVEPVVAPEAPDTENYEALLHLAERLGEAKPRVEQNVPNLSW